MDLRGFEAVVAVYEHGSFSIAAETLFISQPALTRRVALLERELDTRLFVRGPHGVTLTDAGQALIGPARRALQETESIRGAVDQIREGGRGSLDIVAMPNLSGGSLGRVLAEFHERLPEIEIRVIAADTSKEAAAMVESGLHDLAIIDMPSISTALSVTHVVDEDFLAVLSGGSTGDQSGALPTVTRSMLAGRTMVHLPASQFPNQRGMQLFSMLGADPAAHVEVSNCALILPLARSGRAVAVLPRQLAITGREEGGLELALPPRPIRRSIGIARRRGNRSAAVLQFLQVAVARLESSG